MSKRKLSEVYAKIKHEFEKRGEESDTFLVSYDDDAHCVVTMTSGEYSASISVDLAYFEADTEDFMSDIIGDLVVKLSFLEDNY